MRTRTLLILAVVCGFAILLAGGIQLLRIANQESADEEFYDIGEAVEVGDMTIVVESYAESNGIGTVLVRLGGVADQDGAAEFRLVVPGEPVEPNRGSEGACGATTVETQPCVLTFGVADAAGGSRVLVYRRGEEDAHWELTV